MSSTETYFRLTNNSLEFPEEFKFPTNQIPEITHSDLKRGVIRRTFCLYISSGKIVEILTDQISHYSNNYFIRIKTVKWKITGSQRNVYKNNILIDEGAYEYNMRSMQELEKNGFHNIKTFLTPLDIFIT